MKELTHRELFEDFIRKQAVGLYEWSLFLHWIWESLHHKDDEFLRDFTDDIRQSIKKEADRIFWKDATKTLAESLEFDNEFDLYFPDDAGKDLAVSFFVDTVFFEGRDEIEPKNKNSFSYLSLEHRCLSILYDNFDLMKEKLEFDQALFFYELEYLKDTITRDASELIGYWMSKTERIKASRPGAQKRKENMNIRVNKAKTEIQRIAKQTEKGFEIKKHVWHKILSKAFGYEHMYPTPPTEKEYRKRVGELLSNEMGRKIEIIIRK